MVFLAGAEAPASPSLAPPLPLSPPLAPPLLTRHGNKNIRGFTENIRGFSPLSPPLAPPLSLVNRLKKCHKIFLASQLYMSRNVFEITLLCIIVCRGVNKAVCSRVLCLTGGCAHHVLMASAFHFLYSFGLCIIF